METIASLLRSLPRGQALFVFPSNVDTQIFGIASVKITKGKQVTVSKTDGTVASCLLPAALGNRTLASMSGEWWPALRLSFV